MFHFNAFQGMVQEAEDILMGFMHQQDPVF